MNTKKQKIGGFSINEVLVTMFVVSVGLVAVTELFSRGVINSGIDRDRVIAAGLAQEGVEIVKSARDNSLASGDLKGFSFFAPGGVPIGQHCRPDYGLTPANLSSVCSGSNANAPQNNPGRYDLNRIGTTSYYGYAAGANTKFFRYTHINYRDADPKSAEVISFVYWGEDIPTGIESGDVAQCTIGSRCIYSQLHLEAWRP